jgi:hypothetical protein
MLRRPSTGTAGWRIGGSFQTTTVIEDTAAQDWCIIEKKVRRMQGSVCPGEERRLALEGGPLAAPAARTSWRRV